MYLKLKETPLGFTLIELLIVVAIIGILASIAIPNFLEAQTRAKVSRVSSDMRALNLAIETYRVDSNEYPWVTYSNRTDPPDLNNLEMHELTSPIQYITAIPTDVFRDPMVVTNRSPQIDYFNMKAYFAGFPFFVPVPAGAPDWTLSSVGPNTVFDYDTSTPVIYDPSNGTTSRGDIYWDNLQTQGK